MNADPMKEDVLIEYLNSCSGMDMKYRLCPNCFQSVPESEWTPKYKRKWITRVKKLLKQENPQIPIGPYIHIFKEKFLTL